MIKPTPNILVIESKRSELKKVEDFLRQIFDKYEISVSYFNKVFLCLSEAIINSIVHGHKHNEQEKIEIEILPEKDMLSVVVTDQGEGFDLDSIPDPTLNHNLKNESGRGIHIIKCMSETLKYNEKGNSIHFQIKYK